MNTCSYAKVCTQAPLHIATFLSVCEPEWMEVLHFLCRHVDEDM